MIAHHNSFEQPYGIADAFCSDHKTDFYLHFLLSKCNNKNAMVLWFVTCIDFHKIEMSVLMQQKKESDKVRRYKNLLDLDRLFLFAMISFPWECFWRHQSLKCSNHTIKMAKNIQKRFFSLSKLKFQKLFCKFNGCIKATLISFFCGHINSKESKASSMKHLRLLIKWENRKCGKHFTFTYFWSRWIFRLFSM